MASPVATTSRAVLGSGLRASRQRSSDAGRLFTTSTPNRNDSLWTITPSSSSSSSSAGAAAASSAAAAPPPPPAVDLKAAFAAARAAPASAQDGASPASPAPAPSHIEVDPKLAQAERRRMSRTMMDQLATLGSTQTRASSFRPHKMRLNPVTAQELTLNHLVASTAQMGHSLSSLKAANQPFIYGTRHDVAIFDLERATLPALRRAAHVVREVAERDGVILFVGTRPGQQASVLQACKRLGSNGFHVTAERWMPGVITNAPKLLAPAILASMGDADEATASIGSNKLATQHYQPDVLVILNPIENAFAIREATQANIPTIAITDSDVDPRSVTYAIPANDDSLRTVELVVGVLSKAGEEGIRSRKKKLDQAEKVARRMARRLNNARGPAGEESTNFDPRTRRASMADELKRYRKQLDDNEEAAA
ncbi:uncharacterized protein PFL1_05753 [Pseudozyma flocculosa PF-1]|uniref:Related to MRP4 - mitochondrial ribosomal protein, small subunit n=2 Tax=Pseudozyma flocculosa TaxID=84751 RepID=A0A5C3FBY1_9BASI|nr:uncharacterized protein PFL1_05753 [Pseudozyma flocculosa PF-1]EPQ26775.1 hypothetical protein PFL1_05753 [Pseudozyma flocculosa PF-1]SPO40899.1 related to MRP4 - mitochondrial ribosomal protein, small subunit [Pseudozyma flocculosa]